MKREQQIQSNLINHQQTKTIKLNFFNLNVWFVLIDKLIGGAHSLILLFSSSIRQICELIEKKRRRMACSPAPASLKIKDFQITLPAAKQQFHQLHFISHSQREMKRVDGLLPLQRNQTVPFLQLLISLSFHYHSMKFHQLLKYFHCLIPLITVII